MNLELVVNIWSGDRLFWVRDIPPNLKDHLTQSCDSSRAHPIAMAITAHIPPP
jgi:hypothetical protein